MLGDFELALRVGRTPFELARRGLERFAKEGLPELEAWGPIPARGGSAGTPAG